MNTLWHLAEVADWAAGEQAGLYERSTRGASLTEVGFVHCSYPEQLPSVVALLYADVTGDFVVLELDRGALEAAGSTVLDEPAVPTDPQSPLFPHVYGPIPRSAVSEVLAARVDRGVVAIGGRWAKAPKWPEQSSPTKPVTS